MSLSNASRVRMVYVSSIRPFIFGSKSLAHLSSMQQTKKRKTSVPNHFHQLSTSPVQNNHLNVLAHHGNHEIEQSNGLNEGESQNGVGEELSTHAWVAGNSQDEGTENHADTDTSSSESNGSRTHSHVL